MRSSEESLNALVLAAYRAAEDPRAWPDFLSLVAEATRSDGATILHMDSTRSDADVSALFGYGEESVRAYQAHYGLLDPWGLGLKPSMRVPGRVIDGREVVPEAVVRRSEYYADFGRNCGSLHSAFGILEPAGSRVALLTVNRGEAREPYDAEALGVLRHLVPHVSQALRLHRRLATADADRAIACEALDRQSQGVILVDRNGCPLFVNRVASVVVARADGLAITDGRLTGETANDTRRIAAAIHDAVALTNRGMVEGGRSAFRLGRPSGRTPLSVIVTPCGTHANALGSEPRAAAAVLVSDPDRRAVDDVTVLTRLFGLTEAEGRVAALLADGRTLADISDRLRISGNTVRWHVKHILHKTDTRTQAQFVSLVLRSPIGVSGDST